MNEHQLQCFLAVAKHCNFSRAAKEVFLSQPALSYQISHLEKELGVKLFARTTTSVRLTEAGRVFEPYAQRLSADYREGMAALRPYTDATHTLVLTCPPVMIRRAPIYREIVQQAAELLPNYQLEVRTPEPGEWPEKVFQPDADCQIMMEMDELPQGYRSEVLFPTRCYAVAGPGHRFYREERIPLDQLAGETIYYEQEGAPFAEQVLQGLRSLKKDAHLQAVASYDQMFPMLVAGKGIYISPSVYPSGSAEHYLEVEGLHLRSTVLITRIQPAKPAAAQLAGLIRQLYAEAESQNKIL